MTNQLDQFIAITRALSDPTRVRILLALRRGELCVCQLTALCGLAPSTVSKHLAVLYQAGLVQYRKTDRWVYYRLANSSASVVVREALDWVKKSLANTEQVNADNKRLQQILKVEPTELCRLRR
jgi:DNA-binding transcriptional ArsR family regulator